METSSGGGNEGSTDVAIGANTCVHGISRATCTQSIRVLWTTPHRERERKKRVQTDSYCTLLFPLHAKLLDEARNPVVAWTAGLLALSSKLQYTKANNTPPPSVRIVGIVRIVRLRQPLIDEKRGWRDGSRVQFGEAANHQRAKDVDEIGRGQGAVTGMGKVIY